MKELTIDCKHQKEKNFLKFLQNFYRDNEMATIEEPYLAADMILTYIKSRETKHKKKAKVLLFIHPGESWETEIEKVECPLLPKGEYKVNVDRSIFCYRCFEKGGINE